MGTRTANKRINILFTVPTIKSITIIFLSSGLENNTLLAPTPFAYLRSKEKVLTAYFVMP